MLHLAAFAILPGCALAAVAEDETGRRLETGDARCTVQFTSRIDVAVR